MVYRAGNSEGSTIMATTSNILAADKTLAARGDNDKRPRRRMAGLAAVATLGLSLAVGGLLSQGRPVAPTEAQAVSNPGASGSYVDSMWLYREDRRSETRDRFVPDQFTYREDRRAYP